MQENHPPIIVISGAMGSGKGTTLHALVREMPLQWVPTHTTRPVRHDDAVLSHRVFDTETNFVRALSRGEFVEAVEVAGYRYGLLRADIEKELRLNQPVVIEITPEGGLEVMRKYPNTLLIFITASEKERRQRITERLNDKTDIEARMQEGREEEKLARATYHHIFTNVEGHPEEVIEEIKGAIYGRFPDLKSIPHSNPPKNKGITL